MIAQRGLVREPARAVTALKAPNAEMYIADMIHQALPLTEAPGAAPALEGLPAVVDPLVLVQRPLFEELASPLSPPRVANRASLSLRRQSEQR